MKKALTILIAAIFLASGMHISVDRHYCGGSLADVKVSFTGKLASCGMKCSEMELPLTGTIITNHCCDDVVTFFLIDNNFKTSPSFVPESCQYNFQVLAIPPGLSFNYPADPISSYTDLNPPGAFRTTTVDLSSICVFRI